VRSSERSLVLALMMSFLFCYQPQAFSYETAYQVEVEGQLSLKGGEKLFFAKFHGGMGTYKLLGNRVSEIQLHKDYSLTLRVVTPGSIPEAEVLMVEPIVTYIGKIESVSTGPSEFLFVTSNGKKLYLRDSFHLKDIKGEINFSRYQIKAKIPEDHVIYEGAIEVSIIEITKVPLAACRYSSLTLNIFAKNSDYSVDLFIEAHIGEPLPVAEGQCSLNTSTFSCDLTDFTGTKYGSGKFTKPSDWSKYESFVFKIIGRGGIEIPFSCHTVIIGL